MSWLYSFERLPYAWASRRLKHSRDFIESLCPKCSLHCNFTGIKYWAARAQLKLIKMPPPKACTLLSTSPMTFFFAVHGTLRQFCSLALDLNQVLSESAGHLLRNSVSVYRSQCHLPESQSSSVLYIHQNPLCFLISFVLSFLSSNLLAWVDHFVVTN